MVVTLRWAKNPVFFTSYLLGCGRHAPLGSKSTVFSSKICFFVKNLAFSSKITFFSLKTRFFHQIRPPPPPPCMCADSRAKRPLRHSPSLRAPENCLPSHPIASQSPPERQQNCLPRLFHGGGVGGVGGVAVTHQIQIPRFARELSFC